MNQFQHTYYYILNKKEDNALENTFKNLKNQIEIYRRQYELTTKTYTSQWNSEIAVNKTLYDQQFKIAEKSYQDIYNENKDDDYGHQFAMHESGMNYLEMNYQERLEEIRCEYLNFLDLYSKSILISLYSLNESSLKKITNVSSEISNKKIKPSDFNQRNYLDSYLKYLKLVIEVDVQNLNESLVFFKDIQILRNQIVHNNSYFDKDEKTVIAIVEKHVKTLKFNLETKFLKIINGQIIRDMLKYLLEFYEELLWQVDLKNDSTIIKGGINYWLQQLDKNLKISNFKLEIVSKKIKIISFNMTMIDSDVNHSLHCMIKMEKSEKKVFNIINHLPIKELSEFVEFESNSNGKYFLDIFDVFNMDNGFYEIDVTFE